MGLLWGKIELWYLWLEILYGIVIIRLKIVDSRLEGGIRVCLEFLRTLNHKVLSSVRILKVIGLPLEVIMAVVTSLDVKITFRLKIVIRLRLESLATILHYTICLEAPVILLESSISLKALAIILYPSVCLKVKGLIYGKGVDVRINFLPHQPRLLLLLLMILIDKLGSRVRTHINTSLLLALHATLLLPHHLTLSLRPYICGRFYLRLLGGPCDQVVLLVFGKGHLVEVLEALASLGGSFCLALVEVGILQRCFERSIQLRHIGVGEDEGAEAE